MLENPEKKEVCSHQKVNIHNESQRSGQLAAEIGNLLAVKPSNALKTIIEKMKKNTSQRHCSSIGEKRPNSSLVSAA
jgi:hypothetical protein